MKAINLLLVSTGLLFLPCFGYAQTGNSSKPTESNNINVKAMSNESIKINKKYFLNEDIKMIPGAVFYFSDKPFGNSHEGAKTNFKSSDFIYGRLELDNQTIQDAFKLTPIGNNYYV